ncbi:unnamed protein product [Amoebophrya sp. A120]|nr:unnamed protein product [Amoebophrya sp. A120]|eukprot:GSA120T00005148001.1
MRAAKMVGSASGLLPSIGSLSRWTLIVLFGDSTKDGFLLLVRSETARDEGAPTLNLNKLNLGGEEEHLMEILDDATAQEDAEDVVSDSGTTPATGPERPATRARLPLSSLMQRERTPEPHVEMRPRSFSPQEEQQVQKNGDGQDEAPGDRAVVRERELPQSFVDTHAPGPGGRSKRTTTDTRKHKHHNKRKSLTEQTHLAGAVRKNQNATALHFPPRCFLPFAWNACPIGHVDYPSADPAADMGVVVVPDPAPTDTRKPWILQEQEAFTYHENTRFNGVMAGSALLLLITVLIGASAAGMKDVCKLPRVRLARKAVMERLSLLFRLCSGGHSHFTAARPGLSLQKREDGKFLLTSMLKKYLPDKNGIIQADKKKAADRAAPQDPGLRRSSSPGAPGPPEAHANARGPLAAS